MAMRDEAVAGEIMALKVMLGVAFSIAARDKEDARSALDEVLRGCSEQIQEGIAGTKAQLRADEFNTSKLADAALQTVDFVAGVADSMLEAMGR
ncbi:hypothetical protein [Stenotrophomonas maltophilia]|uniref:hypothetical protein n=1 Tax=Stenotrophomonas maltophilia TaxID=40324 RepID=UPI001E3D53D7|nr:hypothetical protein [Stenotrophomonas maltophilia]UGB22600.1 hypothetical protein LQ335_04995 [Stenotrophomonas maltophilia]